MKRNLLALFLMLFTLLGTLSAQVEEESSEPLIQFSGMVLDGATAQLYPVPYTNILVKGEGRGTYSDFNGFFSLVVRQNDTIIFSAIGYKDVAVNIPDSLTDTRYSLVQLMSQDTINLPETVVFPWPSREHFRLEFLAMDVSKEMQDRAMENLAEESLEKGREIVMLDANEHADMYLRQQSRNNYYIGQTPPMNIFNPIAWKQFFDAWKRGDFKSKDKKDKK